MSASGTPLVPWTVIVERLSLRIAQLLLPGTLYGVFALLTLACLFVLITSKRPAGTVRLLLGFTLFALLASTTAFLAINTLASQYLILGDGYISWAQGSSPVYDGDEVAWYAGAVNNCGGTATLTINIFLGDAIVWWRACVLWRGNWPIRVLGVLLLLATFAMGIVDTSWACYRGVSWNPDPHAQGDGYMYEGFAYGVAATGLSLATNVLATSLVAYKSWRYRSFLRKYIEVGTRTSQLEKVTVLLVESGIVYCVLWIIVAIVMSGLNNRHVYDSYGVLQLNSFWKMCSVFVQGALVPLIAIYPTIIIVLVALNRSQVEKQFWTSNAPAGRTETVISMDDGFETRTPAYDVEPLVPGSHEESLLTEKS